MTAVTNNIRESVRSPFGVFSISVLAVALGVLVLAAGPLALVALLGAIAFCVFVRHPSLGLFLTTVLLLLLSGAAGTIGPIRVPIPITVAKLCGAITFAAWVINVLANRRDLHFTGSMALALLFLGWALVGVVGSPMWRDQVPEWVRLATFIAFFIMALHLLDTKDRLHVFVVLVALCGAVMSVYAIIQYMIPAMHLNGDVEAITAVGAGVEGAYVDADSLLGGAAVRVTGGQGHSNWLALALLIILPLNAYWFTTLRNPAAKAFVIAAVTLEIIALMLTFTRTGFLVGIAILLLLTTKRLLRINPYRLATLAVVMLIAWCLIPGPYKERVLTFTQYTGSESVHHRMELQEAAWEVLLEHPVRGAGIGGFGLRLVEMDSPVALIARWLVEDLDWSPVFLGAHNMYMQVASEMGLVGLALLLTFYALLFRDLRKAQIHSVAAGDGRAAVLSATLQISLLSLLLGAIFLHALQQRIGWIIVAAAAALPLVILKPGHAEESTLDAESRI